MAKAIDESIEALVFLFNAQERNEGLYELIWDLGRYPELGIEEKYSLSRKIIVNLIENDLASLVLHYDDGRTDMLNSCELYQYLDNPSNWYPTTSPLPRLTISVSGLAFLNHGSREKNQEMKDRLFIGRDT